VVLLAALLLAACASRPARDGPGLNAPPALERVPDAEPRVEPLRSGGPNKPYEVLGRRYTPLSGDRALHETGGASWYGRKFQGLPTASGEPYDMYAMTAAHKTMPIPSYARVRNPANGREVIVRINDRGPFAPGRIIDLSYTAALKLGVLRGVAAVEVERITNDEIRTGAWRDGKRELPRAAPELAPAPQPTPQPAPEAPLPQDATLFAAAPPAAAVAPALAAAPGFWLQLGAFRQREGAAELQQRVQREANWLGPLLAVFDEHPLFRVQVGPYGSRAEAQGVADKLRAALALTPLLLERR